MDISLEFKFHQPNRRVANPATTASLMTCVCNAKRSCSIGLHLVVRHRPSLPQARSRPKFEGALRAIAEIYPGGVPDQAAEPNSKLCRRVGEKLKAAGLPEVSDDTILRAAGRRRT